MTELDELISKIQESSQLNSLIRESKNTTSKCDGNTSAIHTHCFVYENNGLLPIPQCQNALTYILIKLMSTSPKLIDDDIRDSVVKYFKANDMKASGLVSIENLSTLYKTKSQLLTWLKYETLLSRLIKEQVYEPKTMANEVLATVKTELHPDIAKKFSSVMSACVKYCRESDKGHTDEEEEEKWCEIIDWMSWFLAPGGDHDDDLS